MWLLKPGAPYNHYHDRQEFDRIMARIAFHQKRPDDIERLRQIFNELFLAWQQLAMIKQVVNGEVLSLSGQNEQG